MLPLHGKVTRKNQIMRRKRVQNRRQRGKPVLAKIRRGPVRSIAYREWLRDRKCVICLSLQQFYTERIVTGGTSQACHTENNGMGSKGPDSGCVPMCGGVGTADHHGQYDGRTRLPNGDFGKKAFEAYYRVDLKAEAAAHWAVWQFEQESKGGL